MEDFLKLAGVTKLQLDAVEDCGIINRCLILRLQQYNTEQFKDRNDIQSVYAPNLTQMAEEMFKNCSNLQYIHLPNVKQLSKYVFQGCDKLDLQNNFRITQRQMNNANDGDIINFHLILKKAIYLEGSFKNRQDILFVHAENLKKVSKQMFYECTNLQVITCPQVETVEKFGFQECYSLKSFESDKLKKVCDFGFTCCRSITSFKATNLKTINQYGLNGLTSIKSLHLPNLEEIQKEGVSWCSNLKELNAPKLKKLGKSAFQGCLVLDLSKNFPITQKQINSTKDGQILNHHLILKKGSYPEGSFKKNDDILFVHAENLKVVSKQMLFECSNLQKINCPQVECVGAEGLSNCDSLQSFESSRLKVVHQQGFQWCVSITQFIAPNLEKVQEAGLAWLRSIESLHLPKLLEIQNNGIFWSACLKQIFMPKLQIVGDCLLYNSAIIKAIYAPRINSNQFTCKKCLKCPICCERLQQCLHQGKVLYRKKNKHNFLKYSLQSREYYVIYKFLVNVKKIVANCRIDDLMK